MKIASVAHTWKKFFRKHCSSSGFSADFVGLWSSPTHLSMCKKLYCEVLINLHGPLTLGLDGKQRFTKVSKPHLLGTMNTCFHMFVRLFQPRTVYSVAESSWVVIFYFIFLFKLSESSNTFRFPLLWVISAEVTAKQSNNMGHSSSDVVSHYKKK